MGGLVLPGVADGAVTLGAEEDGAGPEGAGDRVKGFGQAGFLVGRFHVLEQGPGVVPGLEDFREDDTGFLVAETLPEKPPAAVHGRENHRAVVRRGFGEGDTHAAGGLGCIVLEAVRHGEDGDFLGQGRLLAEFGDGADGEGRHLLGQFRECRDFVCERAGDADALLGFDHILEFHAGDAFQFLPGAEAGQGEKFPDGRLGKLRVIPGRFHPQRFQFPDGPASDAPDILGWESPEHLFDVLRSVHVATALEFGILLAQF